MGDSYYESSSVGMDLIRLVFSTLDRPAYWLLGIVYQLFFNVASADIFSDGTIMSFYGRVQAILGVFMMFQLAMTFLRGIVEPDSFSKDKGGGSLLRRIATSMILITILMPINTGGGNEYQKQIHNNGLLFGTLYSLQHRILSNNTIGRLVLGSGTDQSTFMSDNADEQLEQSSRIFTSAVLKGFYRINLVKEEDRVDTGDKYPATKNETRMCKDIDNDVLAAYTRLDADPGEIIGMVNETCTVDFNLLNYLPVVSSFAGTKKYVFTYMPVISTIVGIVFVFILLSFTIEVAVRAVKLAVLRLIAPIPLIAYIDPKGSGDEAFKSWTKTLTSTYLDLFIRLAVVYFVIYLIQNMIVNGIAMNNAGSGIIRALSFILIWVGLFVFAKQAPKFIRQALGLKGDGGFNLFGGFGEIMGAAALGAGAIGSFNAARAASRLSDQVRGGEDKANKWYNRGKHVLAGMAGGISGGMAGAAAWAGAKDHQGKAVMDAINKRNAADIARGASGSTVFGRMSATGHRLFQGEGATSFDSQTREISQKKGIDKSAKDLFSYLEGKGKTDGAGYKVTTVAFDGEANGVKFKDKQFSGTLNDLLSAKQSAVAAQQAGKGDGTFEFDGMKFRTTDASVTKLEEELGYAAGDEWALRQEYGGRNAERMEALQTASPQLSSDERKDIVRSEVRAEVSGAHGDWSQDQIDAEVARRTSSFSIDNGYAQKKDTYNESLNGVNVPKDGNGNPKHTLYTRYEANAADNGDLSSNFVASKLKKTSKAAGGEAGRLESSDAYKKQQADYGATKK